VASSNKALKLAAPRLPQDRPWAPHLSAVFGGRRAHRIQAYRKGQLA
jgi:hypothetical protein